MNFNHFKDCMKMISVGLTKPEDGSPSYIDFEKINQNYKLKAVKNKKNINQTIDEKDDHQSNQ